MIIGIHAHEKTAPQPVIVNIEALVQTSPNPVADNFSDVVCYETIARTVHRIAGYRPINLVETFAEYIADFCLSDSRVQSVKVRVEKTQALDGARAVGTEILRTRT